MEDNWEILLKEYEHLIGKTFVDHKGNEYIFFGLVHADDDYYYGMNSKKYGLQLLSCVGSLKTHMYVLKENSVFIHNDIIIEKQKLEIKNHRFFAVVMIAAVMNLLSIGYKHSELIMALGLFSLSMHIIIDGLIFEIRKLNKK